jgi:hypothetical protein
LLRNDVEIHMQTHRLIGGVYKVRLWNGLWCHHIHAEFNKDWFSHEKVDKRGGGTQTHREYGDLIDLLLFFENKETMLKIAKP